MDPPRQVSRRGPGTGPVFRTFKKSAMHSFSASNSFSIRTPSVPLGMGIPQRMIAQTQLIPPLSSNPSPSAIIATPEVAQVIVIVPPASPVINPVINRPRIIPDQSSIMKPNDVTSIDLKKKSAGLFNVDADLNPRSRGNRGIRTSGIHKVEDAAVIAAANATLNRNVCLKDMVETKTGACKIDKTKQVRRHHGNPRRSSVSIDKIPEGYNLETLWATAAEFWEEPSLADKTLLKEYICENKSGFTNFLQRNYQILEGSGKVVGDFPILERTDTADIIGQEIARSAKCMPPVASLSFDTAGGVDEAVWYQLQRLHNLEAEGYRHLYPSASSSGKHVNTTTTATSGSSTTASLICSSTSPASSRPPSSSSSSSSSSRPPSSSSSSNSSSSSSSSRSSSRPTSSSSSSTSCLSSHASSPRSGILSSLHTDYDIKRVLASSSGEQNFSKKENCHSSNSSPLHSSTSFLSTFSSSPPPPPPSESNSLSILPLNHSIKDTNFSTVVVTIDTACNTGALNVNTPIDRSMTVVLNGMNEIKISTENIETLTTDKDVPDEMNSCTASLTDLVPFDSSIADVEHGSIVNSSLINPNNSMRETVKNADLLIREMSMSFIGHDRNLLSSIVDGIKNRDERRIANEGNGNGINRKLTAHSRNIMGDVSYSEIIHNGNSNCGYGKERFGDYSHQDISGSNPADTSSEYMIEKYKSAEFDDPHNSQINGDDTAEGMKRRRCGKEQKNMESNVSEKILTCDTASNKFSAADDSHQILDKKCKKISLGKRGRLYSDVWSEEEYLSISESNRGVCPKGPLTDWSQLMKNYSDTHDGSYVQWSVNQAYLLSEQFKKSQPNKIGHRMKAKEERSKSVKIRDFHITAPPVPVSMIHPSCWGISSRSEAETFFLNAQKPENSAHEKRIVDVVNDNDGHNGTRDSYNHSYDNGRFCDGETSAANADIPNQLNVSLDTAIIRGKSIERNQIENDFQIECTAEEGYHDEQSLLAATQAEVEVSSKDIERSEREVCRIFKTDDPNGVIVVPFNSSNIDHSIKGNGRSHENAGKATKKIFSPDMSGVFNYIHPGSLSRTIVELPGSAAARDDLEDIDDFSFHSEVLMKELEALETGNYLRLQSLSEAIDTSSQLSVVRERRRKIGEIINEMYKQSEYEYQTAGILLYKNKPPTPLEEVVTDIAAVVPPLLLIPHSVSTVTSSNRLARPDSNSVTISEPVSVPISECISNALTVTVSDTVNDLISDPTLALPNPILIPSPLLSLSQSSPSVSLNPAPFPLRCNPSLSEILSCSDSMAVSEQPCNTLSNDKPYTDGAIHLQTPTPLIYSPPMKTLPSTLHLPVTVPPLLPLISELVTPCFPPHTTSPLPLNQPLPLPLSFSMSPPLAYSLSLPLPLSLPISQPAPYQSRYGTRCSSSQSRIGAHTAINALAIHQKKLGEGAGDAPAAAKEPLIRIRTPQLGACSMKNIPHGLFVSGLKIGDPLEIVFDGKWRASIVVALKLDGALLRHVKVAPLCFLPGESTWVAVEDGRLCPAGWNLDSKQFQWMFPNTEFAQRKENVEGVKLLLDSVGQGRGKAVLKGKIGNGNGKGTGVGKGNYDRKGKKNPEIESSRLITAKILVNSTSIINNETVAEVLNPSCIPHLGASRGNNIALDENSNEESSVHKSPKTDMIIIPLKAKKSGTAASIISKKKKAVVKKKKKSKINFTSLQKKAKIISISVKSSKLPVNSRLSSSSSSLCPSLSSLSSLPLIVKMTADEGMSTIENVELNLNKEEIIADDRKAESITVTVTVTHVVNDELRDCDSCDTNLEEQIMEKRDVVCDVIESEQGLHHHEGDGKEDEVGRIETQGPSISILKSTEGVDDTVPDVEPVMGHTSEGSLNIDALVPGFVIEASVMNDGDTIDKDILLEDMKSATADSIIKKNVSKNVLKNVPKNVPKNIPKKMITKKMKDKHLSHGVGKREKVVKTAVGKKITKFRDEVAVVKSVKIKKKMTKVTDKAETILYPGTDGQESREGVVVNFAEYRDPEERVTLWNQKDQCVLAGGSAPRQKDLAAFLLSRPHYCVWKPQTKQQITKYEAKIRKAQAQRLKESQNMNVTDALKLTDRKDLQVGDENNGSHTKDMTAFTAEACGIHSVNDTAACPFDPASTYELPCDVISDLPSTITSGSVSGFGSTSQITYDSNSNSKSNSNSISEVCPLVKSVTKSTRKPKFRTPVLGSRVSARVTKKLDIVVSAMEGIFVVDKDSDKDASETGNTNLVIGSIDSRSIYTHDPQGLCTASGEEMMHASHDSEEMTDLKVSCSLLIIKEKAADMVQIGESHMKLKEAGIKTNLHDCATSNDNLSGTNVVTNEFCEAHNDVVLERNVHENGGAKGVENPDAKLFNNPSKISPTARPKSLPFTEYPPPLIFETHGSSGMVIKKRKRGRPRSVPRKLPNIPTYHSNHSNQLKGLPLDDRLLLKPPLLSTFEPTASDGMSSLEPYHSSSSSSCHPQMQLQLQLQQELQASMFASLSPSISTDHLLVCGASQHLIDISLSSSPLGGPGTSSISISKVVSVLEDFPDKISNHSMGVTGLVDYSSDENTEQEQFSKLNEDKNVKEDSALRTGDDVRKLWEMSRVVDNEEEGKKREKRQRTIHGDEIKESRESDEDGEEFNSGITTIIGTPLKQSNQDRRIFTSSESDIGSGTESGSDAQGKFENDFTISDEVGTIDLRDQEFDDDNDWIKNKSRNRGRVNGRGGSNGSRSQSQSQSESHMQSRLSGRKGDSRNERTMNRYSMQYDREEK